MLLYSGRHHSLHALVMQPIRCLEEWVLRAQAVGQLARKDNQMPASPLTLFDLSFETCSNVVAPGGQVFAKGDPNPLGSVVTAHNSQVD